MLGSVTFPAYRLAIGWVERASVGPLGPSTLTTWPTTQCS